MDVVGQVLSIIGMVLTIASFQMKTRKQIILVQTAGSVFFLLSYLLLESWSAVYLNVVFLIRYKKDGLFTKVYWRQER